MAQAASAGPRPSPVLLSLYPTPHLLHSRPGILSGPQSSKQGLQRKQEGRNYKPSWGLKTRTPEIAQFIPRAQRECGIWKNYASELPGYFQTAKNRSWPNWDTSREQQICTVSSLAKHFHFSGDCLLTWGPFLLLGSRVILISKTSAGERREERSYTCKWMPELWAYYNSATVPSRSEEVKVTGA